MIMYRKLIWLISFILVLGLAVGASAELVGQWKLDEGSGTTATDSTGNGHDGALEGNPQWVDGYFGGGLQFAGSPERVVVPYDPQLNPEEAFTVSVWANVEPGSSGWRSPITSRDDAPQRGYIIYAGDDGNWQFWVGTGGGWSNAAGPAIQTGEWTHVAATYVPGEQKLYINGELVGEATGTMSLNEQQYLSIGAGRTDYPQGDYFFAGIIDDVRLYDHVLSEDEIRSSMENQGGAIVKAYGPAPKNDTLHADTWVSLAWRAGDFAASHDVYMGDNFDDVNNANRDSELFRGNYPLDTLYYIAGFSGYAYPDGLVPGTTYYWRIDEVNESDPNSPWKGDVWNFSLPPKTAYFPVPNDGAESVDLNVRPTWTAGYGAKLHYVVFGEDFDEVSNTATGKINGTTTYNPGPLKLAKTYYWRVDESDGFQTYKGQVWSFTTLGAVSGPNPADGEVDVKPSIILSWVAGAVAASHDVYFGTDADAVSNATIASPEYKGPKALGEESYDPGGLTLNTTYYWRIDEVNDASSDSPWAGNVWSFTTGDFFVIDDFEDYDTGENQIWYSWLDGLGYGAPGTESYNPGNGTGAAVGDETTASYTEETIVHGGLQSMPVAYDNNKQGYSKYSEVEYTLTDQRDWTAEGVTELSIWFRGNPASVGSFTEGPTGTYTMTGSGADIWAVNGVEADEFHFAYKMLNGAGSIIAKVESVENTNAWAKAGVMIRESLNSDSAHAFACVTPGNGVASQYRPTTGGTSGNFNQTGLAAPYWVKLERSISGLFTVSHSADGVSWQQVTGATPQNIAMGSNVYFGLALTSHDAARTCQAVFSNVTTTGNVTGQWADQDIGILSNDPELLYVAVSNSTGNPAVVIHDDANAAQIDTWTEWVIPLSAFADQGINLTDVDHIAIGLGTMGNTTVAGGSGKMYFDDIRLYQPQP
jgi:hypothetical protein